MPKYAANLSMLWPELDMYDRLGAAADAGFSRVEILFVHVLDVSRLERLLKELQLQLVLFDPAPGDWEAGERGLACDPVRRDDFQHTVRAALETARRLGVQRLNVLTGIPRPELREAEVHQTLIDNFRWAASVSEPTGVTLLVENLNSTDFPGIYVSTADRAAQLVSDVDRTNVRLQLDQYHVGMMGGDARAELRKHLPLLEHVQIADVPGRHQPGTGQQPIAEFLSDLDALGYHGAVGLEYRPSGPTEAALAWLPRALRA